MRSVARRVAPGWTILAASVPMFMVSLNNLVVTNALPAIRKDFGTDVTDLQWVVNGYVLAFASLLLTGAALGDRYGRRQVFLIGVALFTVGSVACALSDSIPALITARVVQGVGAAAVQPLSLTLLAAAVPEQKRSAALGLWGGVNGLGVALGPVVGGAVTEGLAWQWIFWINVPVAAVALPLARWALRESKGRDRGLDLLGMVLVTAAVTLAVWAIVEAGENGWNDSLIVTALAGAGVLLTLFVLWERRAPHPLLPLRFYRIRAFVASNVLSLSMFFGVFGSIFFLAQYLQGPLRYAPFAAGLRTLPWTAMPMIFAPLAGLFTDRLGGGRLMTVGLALQGIGLAWIAALVTPTVSYSELVPALVVAGVGMGLVIGPTSAVVLGSVQPYEHGKASGANNTVREVGGALGVAVLTTVFTTKAAEVPIRSRADFTLSFLHGMVPAIWVGVAVVGVGVLAGLFIPFRQGYDLRTTPIRLVVPKEEYVGRHRRAETAYEHTTAIPRLDARPMPPPARYRRPVHSDQ
ncbi:MFS transporter [Actinocrispum wychmicini]|uniref:EmrB/QacA subfamily drug resistance transporter n=1 Tax=Actinocrispum wychmicini TaxID=1213861 RepID=A0A4R2JTL6_9PSEU|nr:MFS transporter [Actinocrispum wychmicini]TCO60616.1 EmrB/QacA subfamily drug resistance transporter [Actinocrispum wychmicini]